MEILISVIILIALIFGIYIYVLSKTRYIVKINDNQIWQIKSAIELVGLPIITFYQGSKKYHFLLDTGSDTCYLNNSSSIEKGQIFTDKNLVYSGADGVNRECSETSLELFYNNHRYTNSFRIADLNDAFNDLKQERGVSLEGIIGVDFMNKYKYCLDFDSMVIYAKK